MKDKNFKIGDMLLCKKDYINDLISFRKGKEYEVTEILLNAWIVMKGEERFYFIKDDNCNKIEVRHETDLNEFFCSKKDIRKMKIEKLEDIYEKSES